MTSKSVPDFNSVVLSYLKAVGEGTLPIDSEQISELPSDIKKDVADQIESVTNSSTMTRLTGKLKRANVSKVDMTKLLQYFSTGNADAEAPLVDNALDRPLSNYFISTSHNTYLTGNQLYGSASTEAYRDVLRHGCRSIEIDVWDGKSESASGEASKKSQTVIGEPRVLHGHTFTKEVSFRDVCIAIGETAFETSDLPIIVSLEVHAHSGQQEKMVSIMNDVWKNKLVPAPEAECSALPSPAELARKILVKVKGSAVTKSEDDLSALEKTRSISDSEDESSPATSPDGQTMGDMAQGKSPSKIIPSLSALGIYTRAYHFKNFLLPEASLPTHVFSLSEKKVISVHQSDGPSLFRHNRSFMMRAFPSASRVTSSNLDPPVYWRKGIQMVALNWQKIDASIMLNQAMFSGSAGWVLKPQDYRSEFQSNSSTIVKNSATMQQQPDGVKRHNLDLSIEVLAGQSIPPAKHPYVKCELHVESIQERSGEKIENDGRSKDGEYKCRTKVSKNLDFKQELLEFSSIRDIVPALSFVRFKLMDDVLGPDELLAWGCIRLDRLKSGLRFLHMFDTHGNQISAVLLINTKKTVN